MTVLHEELMDARFTRARKATYLALDVESEGEALALVDRFSPVIDGYKVGLELFHRAGMHLVEQLLNRGLRVFLDVKLHDIPNTVAGALRAICQYPIEMVNVHASGGIRMLMASREAVEKSPYQPLLIGVTALTSLSAEELSQIGMVDGPEAMVKRLAKLCIAAQLDGVVCSAHELLALRPFVPQEFERVVPGTRLPTDATHDQRRIATPSSAMATGATRLVLGRAIREASNPTEQLLTYWHEIEEGLSR